MKKLSILLALMLAMSVFLTGCGGGGSAESDDGGSASGDTIKIGIFEPLTGANAAGGELEKEGFELAKELYPTVLGKEIKLVYADNKSEKVESTNAAKNLVEKEQVCVVLGSWGSSNAMAGGPVFQEAGVPAIGTSCTNPLVTLDNPYYFRVTFIDDFQGPVMAKYTYDELGAKKVAVIQEVSSDYSTSLAQFFINEFKTLTGDENCIVAVANYQTGDLDFTAQLTAIKSSGAEAIFAPGNFTESALIMKQARELGIDLPFVGTDTWETPTVIEVGGDAVEGCVFSTFFDAGAPLTDETTVFLDAYKAKYGEDKEPAAVTALAYDSYLVALDAIERAGSADPEAIKAALEQTDAFPGAAGEITFDENGDAVKPAVIKTIEGGKFTYKSIVQPF